MTVTALAAGVHADIGAGGTEGAVSTDFDVQLTIAKAARNKADFLMPATYQS